jgi:hypothetical protein
VKPYCYEETPYGRQMIDLLVPDLGKAFNGNGKQLHTIFNALLLFGDKHGNLPHLNS